MSEAAGKKQSAKLPVIAIVGRPNVGKSSLFNAIVGRKLAIVHEMSGVTRDRVSETVTRDGRRFNIVDTGGLGTLSGEARSVDRWDRGIAVQVEAAVGDADVLLFVADAQAGLTPLDLDVANRLRAAGKPVLAVANKCDSDDFKNDAAEFARLGFGTVYPVCCLRRSGVPSLLAAALAKVPRRPEESEAQVPPLLVTVVGRPNVGKSSLINALIGEERLMTSPVAGTTRDAVDVPFELPTQEGPRPAVLVDTAGLRRKAKVDTVVEFFSVMRAKSAISRADVVLFVVEAGAEGITAQDKKIADLVEQSGKGCVIAANKIDIAKGISQKEIISHVRRSLPNLSYAPLELISAEKKLNFNGLLAQVAEVGRQLDQELPTGVLNRVLQDSLENTPPPVVGSSPLKVYYASMTGTRPPRVLLFVNRPDLAAPEYLLFLKRRLVSAFGLTGIPVVLELRARPKRVESIRRNETAKRGRKAPIRRKRK